MKIRNKDLIEDDRWKFKAGPMRTKKDIEPKVCNGCQGYGNIWDVNEDGEDIYTECPLCLGEGYQF